MVFGGAGAGVTELQSGLGEVTKGKAMAEQGSVRIADVFWGENNDNL